MPPQNPHPCPHTTITLSPSQYAPEVGYKGPTPRQRASALSVMGESGEKEGKLDDEPGIGCFPSPLVLPGDELAEDPTYPPQSLGSWMRENDRNEVTKARRTIYVTAPPNISDDVGVMRSWSPLQPQGARRKTNIRVPKTGDVIEYLAAFYHGLPVNQFPAEELEFVSWKESGRTTRKAKRQTEYVGLRYFDEATRIRTRQSPDNPQSLQINLDDLLDAATAMLPKDAYALLMLVEQDLYQSKDDEFVCGMAIGGDRVAVVSMARYCPVLDEEMRVEREHAWPASHCLDYVIECCEEADDRPKKRARTQPKKKMGTGEYEPSLQPLRMAVQAHMTLPPLNSLSSPEALRNLWLGRVCRTASHELGHCFGIDHCVWFACNMNASGSIREDPRQAPYLCHVNLAKVTRATRTGTEEWYEAMTKFYEGFVDVYIFAALGAWCGEMLKLRGGKIGVSGGRENPIKID
ncbi:hypothetical protein K469DRAFT_743201 [Zopfia rhizophila CBS 207.26]|uniref:Uncharacterized protein n=1 Tax=Zopfia rhizophila CBS 207.26 TaxID=1314779 RepID=A0A6A6D8C9_9PEZI|nr:hypothetical protein K469DRAFT_743201 [Zopfia rhizophila CBS 207.26]